MAPFDVWDAGSGFCRVCGWPAVESDVACPICFGPVHEFCLQKHLDAHKAAEQFQRAVLASVEVPR
jgi:hypothetical protein